MDGFIAHTEDGYYLGAFFTRSEANKFAYNAQKETNRPVLVSKESAYRRKYLRESGLETRVLDRTLQFMSR